MEKEILFGFAEESITPDKSISLTGQFYERISEYVETPITVTAMAVKSADEQMVILSCDLTSVGDSLVDLVRGELKGYKDLDPMKVMINATHTHTSHTYNNTRRIPTGLPKDVLTRFSGGKKYVNLTGDRKPEMNSDEATVYLTKQLSTAVKRAWDNLHPAYYQFGFGRAAIGMCRRAVYDDGTARMWGDTSLSNFEEMESGNDSGIEIGFIFDGNKKLEAVMANVSCPSQIVEQRSYISSDYWGKVKILLREKFGEDLYLVALCGAAGDMCPRDLIRWVDPETPIADPNVKRSDNVKRTADPSMYDIKGTWKAGKRIAREIIDAYEELPEIGEMKSTAEFEHEVITLDLPLRKVTITEYRNSLNAMEDFFAKCKSDTLTFEDNARMHLHAGIVARYELQQHEEVYPSEIHVIRFGDVAIATNPFELFLNYGSRIRARSKASQTFLIQLCNGAYGYLPTAKAEQGSHYSAYVTSGTVGHIGGDLLVRETLKTINKMF